MFSHIFPSLLILWRILLRDLVIWIWDVIGKRSKNHVLKCYQKPLKTIATAILYTILAGADLWDGNGGNDPPLRKQNKKVSN
jgi:hypothetical protein